MVKFVRKKAYLDTRATAKSQLGGIVNSRGAGLGGGVSESGCCLGAGRGLGSTTIGAGATLAVVASRGTDLRSRISIRRRCGISAGIPP